MNRNEKKGLIGLIVILSILVVGLSSYLIYDKELKNKTNDDVATTDRENDITANNEQIDNTLTDTDKLYSEYLKKLKNNLEKFYTEHDAEIRINNKFANGEPYSIAIDKEGILMLSTIEKNYKISNNVLKIFLIDVGNGGYKSLYFIKEDGTLNYFCVDCILDDGVNVEKSKYKNIVNVVNSAFGITYSGAYGPIFIDIEGNVLFD